MTVGPDVNAPRFHDVAMGGGLAVLGAPTSFGAITNPNPGSAYVFRLKEVPGGASIACSQAKGQHRSERRFQLRHVHGCAGCRVSDGHPRRDVRAALAGMRSADHTVTNECRVIPTKSACQD